MTERHSENDKKAEAALVFDQSSRTKLELRGRDRAAFLNNFCTNDIIQLKTGSGCEAFLTNSQAKILAWMRVFALPESLWIDADPGLAEKIIGHLSRYQISEEVEFRDRSSELAQWYVAGPGLGAALNEDLQVIEWKQNDLPCLVRRNDALGSESYDVICPQQHKSSIEETLRAIGYNLGSAELYEALRIEAGTPVYGRDIDETNLPQEVNRDNRAISFTKGCYLGQETVARIHALGHVNRLLVGLCVAGTNSIAAGAKLFHGGKEVGHITSAGHSPRLGSTVALAWARRECSQPGTALDVELERGSVSAQVVKLPMTAPGA